ncbi:hypothetical protein ACIP3U_32100 [[Kitasatospora] papulosa]
MVAEKLLTDAVDAEHTGHLALEAVLDLSSTLRGSSGLPPVFR